MKIVEDLLKAEGGEVTEEVNERSDSKYNNLVVTRQDNYTKILLNRPTRKNAITVEVMKKHIYLSINKIKFSRIFRKFVRFDLKGCFLPF